MSVYSAPWYTPAVQRLLDLALEEDVGRGDVTSAAVIDETQEAEADIIAGERAVVCGLGLMEAVFTRFDWRTRVRAKVADGDPVAKGTLVASVRGPAQALLAGERTALNFLQHLSGVATLTQAFVAASEGAKVRVADTRKTTPGSRALQKYAVRTGGGANHRSDLASGILIKDNHLALVGSVREAVRRARAGAPHVLRIAVEVDDLAQLDEALEAGAEVILLDNFQIREMTEARQARARARAEDDRRGLGRRLARSDPRHQQDGRRRDLDRGAHALGARHRLLLRHPPRRRRARGPPSANERRKRPRDVPLRRLGRPQGVFVRSLRQESSSGVFVRVFVPPWDSAVLVCGATWPTLASSPAPDDNGQPDEVRLTARLETRWLGRVYEWHAVRSAGSTNDLAGARAREGAAQGLVVATERQTAGRGRLGRVWHSPAGENLYLSLLLRPTRPAAEIPPLTLLAGAAVARGLAQLGFTPRLKWPNDVQLVVDGAPRKVAGILTEMSSEGGRVGHVVIGLGLNVNTLSFSRRPRRAGHVAAPRRGARARSRGGARRGPRSAFEPLYEDYVARGAAAASEAWQGFAALGERCKVSAPGAPHGQLEGVTLGIDADGALRLRDDAGHIHRVLSGEIST